MLPQAYGPRILLVEGQTDKNVVDLIRASDIALPSFETRPSDGIDNLKKAIPAILKGDDIEVLGIVIDANDSMLSRWQSAAHYIRKAAKDRSNMEIKLPTEPAPGGTIIPDIEDFPRVGVWIMPDNHSSGEMEDFLANMIPADDPFLPLAQEYAKEQRKSSSEGRKWRAQIHAWLTTRGYLDTTEEPCQRFTAWLRDLFGESAS